MEHAAAVLNREIRFATLGGIRGVIEPRALGHQAMNDSFLEEIPASYATLVAPTVRSFAALRRHVTPMFRGLLHSARA